LKPRSNKREGTSAGESRASRTGAVVAVALVLLGGVCYPLWRDAAVVVFGSLFVAAVGSQLLGRTAWCVALDRFFERRPVLLRMTLAASSVLAVVGGLELAAQVLTRSGLVRHRPAMETMLPAGAEDWRLAHITADRYREPDPELLWQPVARSPYNRQRFKGPLLDVPKPAGVFRILCYGDSNTDGPPTGGWPEHLQALLSARTERKYEVVNAGVAGYSSYQGLRRFRREVATYRPDLVLVSFGWNDAAPALGAPDRDFRPPPPALAAVQRVLLRYRWYLLARQALPESAATPIGPRVSVSDYTRNLAELVGVAAAHGGRAVLLTRPHRLSVAALEALGGSSDLVPVPSDGSWRAAVPAYNRALLDFAAISDVPVIDVQAELAEHPQLFGDETHLEDAGRKRMAEIVERSLEEGGLL
jgi:lysophospholipase L1-like esterase